MNFPVKIVVRYDNGKPVYYKEGFYDSNNGETPPTGTAASDISDGSFIMDTYSGIVKQYNEHSDEWKDRIELTV
jgi:hypothetical protein